MKWMARQTNIHNTRFLFLVALILGSCSAWHQTQTDTHTHTHTHVNTRMLKEPVLHPARAFFLSVFLSFFFLPFLPERVCDSSRAQRDSLKCVFAQTSGCVCEAEAVSRRWWVFNFLQCFTISDRATHGCSTCFMKLHCCSWEKLELLKPVCNSPDLFRA